MKAHLGVTELGILCSLQSLPAEDCTLTAAIHSIVDAIQDCPYIYGCNCSNVTVHRSSQSIQREQRKGGVVQQARISDESAIMF